ncbi:hypothetical protein Sjap_000816 [Stephania japonica]|uniref:Uncharacterized protein n=1 Tax=Stephania japonica TaxID=461633 RepID=A0AAP0KIU2_9MAGN
MKRLAEERRIYKENTKINEEDKEKKKKGPPTNQRPPKRIASTPATRGRWT